MPEPPRANQKTFAPKSLLGRYSIPNPIFSSFIISSYLSPFIVLPYYFFSFTLHVRCYHMLAILFKGEQILRNPIFVSSITLLMPLSPPELPCLLNQSPTVESKGISLSPISFLKPSSSLISLKSSMCLPHPVSIRSIGSMYCHASYPLFEPGLGICLVIKSFIPTLFKNSL